MKVNVRNGFVVIVLSMMVLAACQEKKKRFEKLALTDAGISFENKLSPSEDFNIIDYLYFYNGGGVAIGDINGDGLQDIFFSGNQVKNKLYLNKGNLQFEDITDRAGVAGNSTWNTGSVMADVNGDGRLDIYVCAVVGLKNLQGNNELYINNGDNTFSEEAARYGLDFDTYSSNAAFLDYDLDGDLDVYLLNHAVHTQGSFGHANLRNVRTYETGDKLMRNDGGKFVDVSEEAKIFGGMTGYGLGVAVSDFDLDGYPDIYVGNDFHEDDYLYMNQRDGTFKEMGREAFTLTSKFSMGNDVADVNHDGYPDILSLDMLPEDEEVIKRSEGDESLNTLRLRTQEYGYYYQFERNVMQINQGNGRFAETALMSGIAATDWSWSALFSDFDQDGHQDVFVSNGIPRRPNDLDYIKYVSSEQIANTIQTTKLVDEKALEMMPSGDVQNYIFKGNGGYQFENKSSEWLPEEKNCSAATALADLDNDGDIDVVINNINNKAAIYINQTNSSANYLKIQLKSSAKNSFGIGARVYSFHNGIMQMKEMYTVRGFQSSSEPTIHFGYGAASIIDSVVIVWPTGIARKLTNVKPNQTINVSPDDGVSTNAPSLSDTRDAKLFEAVNAGTLGLAFEHKEDVYTDFNRLKLLPYQQSDRGPATAVGDINNDGKEDVFFGGSKFIPAQVFVQSNKGFEKKVIAEIQKDSIKEDVEAIISDLNKDGKNDLFVASGGADFYGKAKQLLDTYYYGTDSSFSRTDVPAYYENASCIKAHDFDNDGDIDLFVGNESTSNDFGKLPRSLLLINEKGTLSPVQQNVFDNLGMVTDATWSDFDNDGQTDLIVVGEWMSPTFLRNEKGEFSKVAKTADALNGLWQSVSPFDIDEDGDLDFILGNWGLNTKFKTDADRPLKMYYNDFDENGTTETVVAVSKNGKYYPLDGFDLLSSQVVILKKKFTSYESFAGRPIEDIFSKDQLKDAEVFEVHQLASGYLLNEKGNFTFVAFPLDLQVAPIMTQLRADFDMDGQEEVLLAGNYFGMQPFHGRYGSFGGAIIKKNGVIVNGRDSGLDLFNRSVRHLNIINVLANRYLLVTINNGPLQVYKLSGK